jgi:hypothetical protein
MGYGLIIEFIEFVQLVATSKDYALAVLQASQITTGHARSSHSVTVFTSLLAMASNGGTHFPLGSRPQLSASHSNSSQLNHSGYLTSSLTVLVVIPQHGLYRDHHSSVVTYGQLPSNGRCLVVFFADVA